MLEMLDMLGTLQQPTLQEAWLGTLQATVAGRGAEAGRGKEGHAETEGEGKGQGEGGQEGGGARRAPTRTTRGNAWRLAERAGSCITLPGGAAKWEQRPLG